MRAALAHSVLDCSESQIEIIGRTVRNLIYKSCNLNGVAFWFDPYSHFKRFDLHSHFLSISKLSFESPRTRMNTDGIEPYKT